MYLSTHSLASGIQTYFRPYHSTALRFYLEVLIYSRILSLATQVLQKIDNLFKNTTREDHHCLTYLLLQVILPAFDKPISIFGLGPSASNSRGYPYLVFIKRASLGPETASVSTGTTAARLWRPGRGTYLRTLHRLICSTRPHRQLFVAKANSLDTRIRPHTQQGTAGHMCLQTILSFNKCHHTAQTLTLCGRNGFSLVPPLACANCDGRFIQHDAVCHGCHRVLLLVGPGASVDDLGGVEAISYDMPFSYVVYGLLPAWINRPTGPPTIDREQMPTFRTRECRLTPLGSLDMVVPLEDMLAWMHLDMSATRNPQGECPWARPSTQLPASAPEGRQSSRYDQARELRQTNKMPPSRHVENPTTSPANKSLLDAFLANPPRSRPDKKLSATPSSKRASSRRSHAPFSASGSCPEERKPRSSKLSKKKSYSFKSGPSERPLILSSEPKKRVSFARSAEVQYFRKDLAPRSVKHRWNGRAADDKDFTREMLAA